MPRPPRRRSAPPGPVLVHAGEVALAVSALIAAVAFHEAGSSLGVLVCAVIVAAAVAGLAVGE